MSETIKFTTRNAKATTKYFLACYSLIQDAQYNLHLLTTDKKEAFRNWLMSFDSDGIKEIDYSHNRHFSIACKEYTPNCFFMKFAKHKGTTVTQKTQNDFVLAKIDDYPNCKIFINTDKNTMLIEHNLDVADTVLNTKKIIEGVIRKDIRFKGYSIDIELITKPIDFWNYVNDNIGKITSVEFTLVRPNFLEGIPTVTDYVNGFSSYNIESVTTKLQNKDGNLSLSPANSFINDALGYCSAGAGKWSVSAKGKKRKKSSEDTPIFFDLPSDIESLTQNKIHELNAFFSSVDQIVNENKEINHEKNTV